MRRYTKKKSALALAQIYTSTLFKKIERENTFKILKSFDAKTNNVHEFMTSINNKCFS